MSNYSWIGIGHVVYAHINSQIKINESLSTIRRDIKYLKN